MVYNSIFETIGNTPVVKFSHKKPMSIYAKLEYFNAGGSVKDRVAKYMILELKKQNKINENSIIVEPTSGNTGIGIAMICSSLNIKCVFTMPETMSIERRKILKAYGAEIILTDGSKGMAGAIEEATRLSCLDNYIMLCQFDNEDNPKAHELSTALEIVNDFKDTGLDVFISCIGTGGTITGISKVLKTFFPKIHIIAIEPKSSPFLTKGEKGPHKIQGIGAGFKPRVLSLDFVDEIITVFDEDALSFARKSGLEQGILLGISGGAGYKVAYDTANKLGDDKNILFISADNGERYLSTSLYEE